MRNLEFPGLPWVLGQICAAFFVSSFLWSGVCRHGALNRVLVVQLRLTWRNGSALSWPGGLVLFFFLTNPIHLTITTFTLGGFVVCLWEFVCKGIWSGTDFGLEDLTVHWFCSISFQSCKVGFRSRTLCRTPKFLYIKPCPHGAGGAP